MKVRELLEAKTPDQMTPGEIVKKLSKDELITYLLQMIKDPEYSDWGSEPRINKIVIAAKNAGKDYPEFQAIVKSLHGHKNSKMSSYDTKRQVHKGTSKEWMYDNEITPEMIHAALEKVKQSKVFKDVSTVGLKYKSEPGKEKNGNLTFTSTRLARPSTWSGDSLDSRIAYGKKHSRHGDVSLKSKKPEDIVKYILRMVKDDYAEAGQQAFDMAKREKITLPDAARIQTALDNQHIVPYLYQVSVNGQVWHAQDPEYGSPQLVRAPSPHIPVEGDKVQAIVKNYEAGLTALIAFAKKHQEKDASVRSKI